MFHEAAAKSMSARLQASNMQTGTMVQPCGEAFPAARTRQHSFSAGIP